MRYSCVQADRDSYELLDNGTGIGFIRDKEKAEEIVRRLNITEDPLYMQENAVELFQKLHQLTDDLVESIADQCMEIGAAHGAEVIVFNTPISLYQDHEDRYEPAYEELLSIDREARMEVRSRDGDVTHIDLSEWTARLDDSSRYATWALTQINDALLDATEWEPGTVEV